jgi:hypothetical protein
MAQTAAKALFAALLVAAMPNPSYSQAAQGKGQTGAQGTSGNCNAPGQIKKGSGCGQASGGAASSAQGSSGTQGQQGSAQSGGQGKSSSKGSSSTGHQNAQGQQGSSGTQGQQGSVQSGGQGKGSSSTGQQNTTSQTSGGGQQGTTSQTSGGGQQNTTSLGGQQGTTSQTSGGGQQGATSQTGQANANADLSAEQRTRIREIVLNQGNAPRMARADFPASVGTVVPPNVRFVRLPARIARIYPAWRDYDYVMVRDRILIIDPVDRRIVAVLES